MAKTKVVIIGAGFSGFYAAKYLKKRDDLVDITIIDKFETNQFRPLIPDIVSNTINASYVQYPLLKLKNRFNLTFFCSSIDDIHFETKEVILPEHTITYDYLIISAGSQSAFPPSEEFKKFALRLDTIHDANLVRDCVLNGKYDSLIVCGGGYTGIELASNLQKLIKNNSLCADVTIVEMTDRLIGTLPVWMQHYASDNLKRMGIHLQLSTRIEAITQRSVLLSNGIRYENALCIWTAGLISSSLTRNLNLQKTTKGRIKVNQFLQCNENCFAAGDIACFSSNNECQRLTVQNAIDQGRLCAKNIIQSILCLPMSKYTVYDPGFIIPMANGKSCGEVFGIKVKGRAATILHYLLSTYRSHGVRNRIAVLKNVLRAF